MRNFKDQVAIVTGAGQGIGFEICRQLVDQGAKVVLNDIDELLAREAAQRITSDQGRCIPYAGNAANTAFIYQMVSDTVKQFGKVDIAIANAGITLFGDFFEYKPADFEKVMNVNLSGSFFFAQAAALQMKTNGVGGRILLMSSVTGHQAHKNLAAYGMSKAALEMLAKTLVIELSPFSITINAVAPGATITERTSSDPDFDATLNQLA